MEKRYVVFISSTFRDLQHERNLVFDAIMQHDCFPVGMEDFPVLTGESLKYIYKLIDESDFVVLLIGGRYGSSRSEDGKSYTQLEFEHAKEAGKPIIALYPPDWGSLSDKETEVEDIAKLLAFINDVKQNFNGSKPWTNETLGTLVYKGIDQAIKDHPEAVGWVRADSVPHQFEPNKQQEEKRIRDRHILYETLEQIKKEDVSLKIRSNDHQNGETIVVSSPEHKPLSEYFHIVAPCMFGVSVNDDKLKEAIYKSKVVYPEDVDNTYHYAITDGFEVFRACMISHHLIKNKSTGSQASWQLTELGEDVYKALDGKIPYPDKTEPEELPVTLQMMGPPFIPTQAQIREMKLTDTEKLAEQIKQEKKISDEKVKYYSAEYASCFAHDLMALPIKPNEEISAEFIKKKIEGTHVLRDLYLNVLQKLVLDSAHPETFAIATIESVMQAISDYPLSAKFSTLAYKEPYEFLVWDMFLSTNAMFMFYAKYESMGSLLTRKYNAGHNYLSNYTDEDIQMSQLRVYLATLNGKSTPGVIHEATMSARLLLQREMKPSVTKLSLTNVDVLICQLSHIYSQYNELETWIPETLSCFDDSHMLKEFWQKLLSSSECPKMLTLFNVGNVHTLKFVVEENKLNKEMKEIKLNNKTVPYIAEFIDAGDISTLN